MSTAHAVSSLVGSQIRRAPTRAVRDRWLGRRLAKWMVARGEFHMYTGGPGGPGGPGDQPPDDGPVIDGDYDDVTPRDRPRGRRDGPWRIDDDR